MPSFFDLLILVALAAGSLFAAHETHWEWSLALAGIGTVLFKITLAELRQNPQR